jgi:predicted phosphoribosyltransferase
MFRDRNDAAQRLARQLQKYHGREDAVVLAVPRGGVVIGAVLARELRLPLDIVLVKKIGHPSNSELAVGAVSLTSEHADPVFLAKADITPEYIKEEAQQIREDLREQYRLYRGHAKPIELADKIVILTDDGAATGNTLIAAISLIRQERPARIIVALPVAPAKTATLLSLQADEVLCLESPQRFDVISRYYRVFGQVDDEEAVRLLASAEK